MDWQLLLERGIIAYREGRTEDAIQDLENAVRLNAGSTEAFFTLGNAYARLGNHERAVKAFQLCAILMPESSEPHSNMANSYMALGNYASAVKEFEVALRLNPNDRVAQSNLPVARMLKEHQKRGGKITRY